MNASSFLLDLSERSCADLRLQKLTAHATAYSVRCLSLFVFVSFLSLVVCFCPLFSSL